LVQAAHTLLIVNPNKAKLSKSPVGTQQPAFQYLYSYQGAGASQSWIGAGRYVVVDVAAGPASYGPANAMEGAVSAVSVPRLEVLSDLSGAAKRAMEAQIKAELVAMTVDAVKHVLLPDVECNPANLTEKVYVPVLVFRNHDQFDPLSKESGDFFIDLENIRNELQKLMLPNQQVTLFGQTEELGDHVGISRLIARSLREDTVHEPSQEADGRYVTKVRPYLDSAVIRSEFNRSLHVLDSIAAPQQSSITGDVERPEALWQFLHPAVKKLHRPSEILEDVEDGSQAQERLQLRPGVRILPIYVFSLLGLQQELLIDQKDLVSASQDGIVVVQTGSEKVEVPFYQAYSAASSQMVTIDARKPTVHIFAGLATAFAGLVAPTDSISAGRRPLRNSLWASGHSPWGVFSRTLSLSALALDLVVRNGVLMLLDEAILRMRSCIRRLDGFMEKYLYDPFATEEEHAITFGSVAEGGMPASPLKLETMRELVGAIEKYQDEFSVIGTHVGSNELHAAYEKSTKTLERVRKFERFSKGLLDDADKDLSCCELEHHVNKAMDYMTVLYLLGGAFTVYVLALRWARPSRNQGGRKQ